MDHSGNSGSLQSSSGAEEDYDSRAAADSIFMTTTHPPPPLLFDPFSNYMQLHHQNHINNNNNNSSSLLHPNMDNWPRPATLRSDPNPPMLSPASAPGHLSSMPSFQVLPTAAGEDSGGGVGPTRSNPKKRSRASRRAPTTVLTTDTTNFRAMVQEFTGVPAPPFTNSSFQPRTSRLDLFGTRPAAPPPYLRRPFAQKAHESPPPPLSSSTTTTSSINYQLPIISTDQFNNIAPPNPLVFTNSLVTTSKPHHHHHHEFEIQPENDVIGGLPNLISSDQISYRGGNNNNTGSGWGAMNNNNDGVNGSGDYDRVKPSGGDDHRSNNIENIIGGTRRVGGGGGSSSQGMVESWICSSD